MAEKQGTGTAIERREPGEIATWIETTIARAELPPGLSQGRLAKAVLQTFRKKPGLLDPAKTDQDSLKLAIIDAGMMGLVPDGVHGALVPYHNKTLKKDEVQFQPMFQGIVQIILAIGAVKKIEAHVVYEHDAFDWEKGLHPRLVHKPKLDGPRGEPAHVYAVAWFTNGAVIFEPMTRTDVLLIRARSKAFQQQGGPWITDEGEMWRKTAVKRLAKYMPKSEPLERALAHDNEIEYADDAIVEDSVPLGSRTEQTRQRLATRVPQGRAGDPEPVSAENGREASGDELAGRQPEPEPEATPETPAAPPGPPPMTPEEERARIEALHKRYMVLVREKRPSWVKNPEQRRTFQFAYVSKRSTKDFTDADYGQLIDALEKMPPEGTKK